MKQETLDKKITLFLSQNLPPSGGRVCQNEWHAPTARWLNELCHEGQLPAGNINTTSITDLNVEDLKQYDQCHFFAGIGGWPLALRWAGLEHVPGIWTGSPPCQPFSAAGKHKAQEDERHLAPVWLSHIRKCRPSMVFGEQVEAALGYGWLDDLCHELEKEGYACGAAILPACSVGSPHIRKRIFFGAVRLDNPPCINLHLSPETQLHHPAPHPEKMHLPASPSADDQHTRMAWLWHTPDWLPCVDGKLRPVEPGTAALVDGLPQGVERGRIQSLEEEPAAAAALRVKGYGNAIVPQVAARFIRAFVESVSMLQGKTEKAVL